MNGDGGGGSGEGGRGGSHAVGEEERTDGGAGERCSFRGFAGEEGTKAVEGAAKTFGGGGFGDVESGSDFRVGFLLVETEKDHLAVARGEAIESGFERGFDFVPVRRWGGGGSLGHGGGLRFVAGAAVSGAEDVGGDKLRSLMQPGA